MSTALVRYEEARRALAEAHRVDEVKNIRDKAEAMGRTPREKDHAKDIVAELIQSGALVMYGDKKGAKYGLPRGRL